MFLHYGDGLITFLKPHEPSSASLNFYSTSSSLLLDFVELKRARVLLWITFWLKGMLWLVWWSNQTTKTFPISTITVSFSYHLCVHWSFTFHFFQELFPCIHNLATWCKRLSLQHIFAFDMPSFLSLITSSFWLIGHCKVINWPHFYIMSEGIGMPEEKERWEMTDYWSNQNSYIYWASVLSYKDAIQVVPKQLQE